MNSKSSSSAHSHPIYINASDLAAAAGLHYYVHRNHILVKSFKQLHPDLYAAAAARDSNRSSNRLQRLATAAAGCSQIDVDVIAGQDDRSVRKAAMHQAHELAAIRFDLLLSKSGLQESGQLVAAAAAAAAAAADEVAAAQQSSPDSDKHCFKRRRYALSDISGGSSDWAAAAAAAAAADSDDAFAAAAAAKDSSILPASVKAATAAAAVHSPAMVTDLTAEADDDIDDISVVGEGVSPDMAALLADAAAAPGATVDRIAAILPGVSTAAITAALNSSSSSNSLTAGLVAGSNPGGGSSVLEDFLQVQSTEAAYMYSMSMYSISRTLRTKISSRRGLRIEPAALQLVAAETGQQVVWSNSTLYCRDVPLPGGGFVRLGGRVDGWLADRSAIVEVKSRQGGLFRRVRDYDRVQVMAYLYLTGAKKCYFMKCYGSAQQGMDSWSTDVVWDGGFWEGVVVPGLQGYVRELQRVVGCSEAQDSLLASVM